MWYKILLTQNSSGMTGLNSIIRPQNKIKNKNLNHNHIENKKNQAKLESQILFFSKRADGFVISSNRQT